MEKIIEENTEILAHIGKISKELPVFYNPIMKRNRDISVLLLNSLNKKDMQICDLLSGSGIRAIRFSKELNSSIIKLIVANDNDLESYNLIKNNVSHNKVEVKIENKDANDLLISSNGFDYIDIDPFGSPNPFLNNSIMRLARDGILAVTATDTAALSGTYPDACYRKYFAKPLRNELKHEIGLRILARKVQLIGTQFEKALTPIFSYSTLHYFRIFFKCEKAKSECDKIIKNHKFLNYCNKCMNVIISENNLEICCNQKMEYAGPLYIGNLWDSELIQKMISLSKDESLKKFLEILKEESEIDLPYFFDTHKYSKITKKTIQRKNELIDKLILNNIKASKTHINDFAIRTKINEIKKYI